MDDIEEQNMDISQILQMANMLGTMLNPVEGDKKEDVKTITQYKSIPFDEELQTQDMKIIKSVLPYMNISQQKVIGVLIKFMEIKMLLEKEEDETTITIQNQNNEQWHKDVLLAVKPHCPDDKQNMLNMMLKMLEMKKILLQIETLKGVF